MQVILSGLHGDATEAAIAEGMGRFLNVRRVVMIREGMNDSPWALIEVHDPYERVWSVCNQLRGVFHRGKALRLYIPLHQEGAFHDLGPDESVNIG